MSPQQRRGFQPSRRMVFHGLGALSVAAALAGCGGDSEPDATDDATTSPSPTDTASSEPTSKPTEATSEPTESSEPPAEEPSVLATTAEVPLGGGIVLMDERIVLTQPEKGQFQAFSAVCKHQGETVGKVEGGTITCLFHGSQYDAATGDVTGGPAPSGLDPIKITVVKGDIVLA